MAVLFLLQPLPNVSKQELPSQTELSKFEPSHLLVTQEDRSLITIISRSLLNSYLISGSLSSNTWNSCIGWPKVVSLLLAVKVAGRHGRHLPIYQPTPFHAPFVQSSRIFKVKKQHQVSINHPSSEQLWPFYPINRIPAGTVATLVTIYLSNPQQNIAGFWPLLFSHKPESFPDYSHLT